MISKISTEIIYQKDGARETIESNVAALMGSMKESGLLTPILVKKVNRYHGGILRDCYEIIAGNHRYKAAVNLGWLDIACQVVDVDDLHAELAEIDENLIRANLTPAQEASAIARRKAIYEELHPETKAGAAQAIGMNKTLGNNVADNLSATFTAATSQATGKDERTIRRAARRGEKLGDDLKEIEGTSLDKGVEIDALAKMDEQERRELIERAKAGEFVSARKEKIELQPYREETTQSRENIQYEALVSAWNDADDKPRKWFLAYIGARQ